MGGRGLVICESPSSTWHYHLREVPEGGPELGGIRDGAALCGAKVGWDTKINLDAWGTKSHIPERWCSACFDLAKRLLDSLEGAERADNRCVCEVCRLEYRQHPDAYFDYKGEPYLTRLCDGRVVKL